MTEKLYYADPFLTDFTATVLSCEEGKDGWQVALDRTAFYPEGGGQPSDTGVFQDGRSGDIRVIHVRDREGRILHLCDRPVAVGTEVTGRVDFPARFDHMQQHSGEHIVSGIICRRYGCENVGFHLGKEAVMIDFNAPIPPEDLPLIEQEANQYIWQDRAVEIELLSGAALAAKSYRSKREIPGEVRIVTFPQADCCACCGTHVLRAGQVGFVRLLNCQKLREGVRIELLCGQRAANYCAAVADQNTKISQLLSAKPLATFSAVDRQHRELAALRTRLLALEEENFSRRAAELKGRGDVVLFQPDMAPDSLRRLCDTVLTSCGGRCAIFAGDDDAGYKYAIGDTVGDVRPLVKALNEALGGRGGGKPHFAQGSVQGTKEAIETVFASIS